MSMLEKLQIQGIRSFGPTDANKQMMSFFSPLTLILGSNGTGKTTIIECLRNATTGDLPPGQGKVFIHDPKLNHETEVNASIKLRFQDVRGEPYVVNRLFLLKQNKNNTTFKTVDANIVHRDQEGNKTTATSKCCDINATVVELLGVPRAILENVIFCHQTDSNWPLSEGQTLKTKFDNIFAATQYIKALENIRKLRLEYNQGIKLLSESTKYLKANKEKADEYEEEIAKDERRLADCIGTLQDIETKLEPLHLEWKEMEKKEDEARNFHSKLSSERDQLDYTRNEIQRITRNLKEVYPGPTEELKRDIENFESKLLEDKASLDKHKKELQKLCLQMSDVAEEQEKLLPALGRLESEKTAVEETSRKVERKSESLNQKLSLGVTLCREDSLEKKVSLVVSCLDNRVSDLQLNFETTKEKREAHEKSLQDSIDSVRERKSKSEQKRESTQKQIADNQKKIMVIRKELLQAEGYCSEIRELESEISKFEDQLASLEREVPSDQLKDKIADKQRSKDEITDKLENLNRELASAQKFSKEQSELEHIRRELSEKIKLLEQAKVESERKFMELLGTFPASDYAKQVNEKISSLSSEVSLLRDSVTKLRTTESSLETKLKMLEDDLKKKEKELDKSRKKVISVCGSENLDGSIQQLKLEMTKMRDEKGFITGSEFMFRKYIERMRQSPCCPLCKRHFEELELVNRLIEDLETKMRVLPEELKKKTREIDDREHKFNDMQRLKGEEDKMSKLRNNELPEVRAKILNATTERDRLTSLKASKEEQLDMKIFDLEMARSLLGEAETMDRLSRERDVLRRQLDSKSPNVQRLKQGRTMENIMAEIRDLNGQARELESTMLDYRAKQDQYHSLGMSLNAARSKKLQLESKKKEESRLRKQKTELESESENLKLSLDPLMKEKEELQKQLQKAVWAKESAVNETRRLLEDLRSELSARVLEREDLKKHFDKVQEYFQSKNPEELQDVRKKLDDLKGEIEHLQLVRDEKTALIDTLEKKLSRQELRERELKDNLHLHMLQVQSEQHKVKIDEIKNQMRSSGLINLESEKKKIGEKINKLRGDKNFSESKKGELKVKIDAARRELSGHFKDAKKKYMTALCEKSVKDYISKDLDMYYRAVNFAVLKYHEQKMKDINKVIKQLWQDTYSGDDIDYVQIRTDADEKGLENSRRAYNYRVVMMKGRIEQDMRGRCSAGQKVLASLIIRLALAETFCQNCGILALDEPTTNLDRSNIKGLALSLAKIVEARMRQRNFQMIVITHDEEFLRLLSQRISVAEYFYKVEKTDMGYSKLQKARLGTIM